MQCSLIFCAMELSEYSRGFIVQIAKDNYIENCLKDRIFM